MGGWVIELLFRRFFSSHKWINPGFLTGPYLPLYGFGLCAMYFLCNLDFSFVGAKNLQIIVMLIVVMLAMTIIEYIAGLIFIKGLRIKLWDYSRRWGNIQGIICPLFTLLWGAVGAGYYFLMNPWVISSLDWLFNNLAYSFFVGVFYGVIVIDFAHSLGLATKLRKFASEHQAIIGYENLKEHIHTRLEQAKLPTHFILPFNSDKSLKESADLYLAELRKRAQEFKNKNKAK